MSAILKVPAQKSAGLSSKHSLNTSLVYEGWCGLDCAAVNSAVIGEGLPKRSSAGSSSVSKSKPRLIWVSPENKLILTILEFQKGRNASG